MHGCIEVIKSSSAVGCNNCTVEVFCFCVFRILLAAVYLVCDCCEQVYVKCHTCLSAVKYFVDIVDKIDIKLIKCGHYFTATSVL